MLPCVVAIMLGVAGLLTGLVILLVPNGDNRITVITLKPPPTPVNTTNDCPLYKLPRILMYGNDLSSMMPNNTIGIGAGVNASGVTALDLSFWFWSDSRTRNGVWTGVPRAVNDSVYAHLNDSSVVAYYAFDEPANPAINISASYQVAAYEWLKQVDPTRPVLVATPFWWWPSPLYTHAYDVLLVDEYSDDYEALLAQYRIARDNGYTDNGKQIMPILRAFVDGVDAVCQPGIASAYSGACATFAALATLNITNVWGVGFYTWTGPNVLTASNCIYIREDVEKVVNYVSTTYERRS